MNSRSSLVSISPDVMSGTPVFVGTRVPVQTLIDYLKAGESIDDFFRGVSHSGKESKLLIFRRSEQIVDRCGCIA